MQSADEPATPATVGPTLSAARRAAGLTVDDVSARTRIRASLINQIEQDDFSGCGGAVYARGHLRSIATTLGLDPTALLESYDAEHERERVPSPIVVPSPEFDPLHGAGGGRRRGGFRWAPAMIASLAVVCVLALVALFLPSGDDDSDSTARPQPTAPASAAAPTAPTVPPAAPPTTSPPPGVNVRVEARDAQSWLEVRDDGERVLLQQMLEQGDSREVSSEGALEIRMGNAGAVDLSCNGQNLGPPGAPGQVVTVRLAVAANGAGCTMGGEDAPGFAAGELPTGAGPSG